MVGNRDSDAVYRKFNKATRIRSEYFQRISADLFFHLPDGGVNRVGMQVEQLVNSGRPLLFERCYLEWITQTDIGTLTPWRRRDCRKYPRFSLVSFDDDFPVFEA